MLPKQKFFCNYINTMSQINILSQTLTDNYKINEKASLLSINQCKNYLKIVIRHLNEILNRLNSQKEIILYKVAPTLAPNSVRQAGLLSLKGRMEEMVKFIDSCEINGKKTIASSEGEHHDEKKCNSVLFPMTSGLIFTDEPAFYDLNTQNLVFKPIYVGLHDLGLESLYHQLCEYIKLEPTDNNIDTDTDCDKFIESIDNSTTDDESYDIVDRCENNQYTKYIYIWKYKYEKAIEKITSLIDLLNSQIDILDMRKNFIIAETQDKISINNLFNEAYKC